MAQVTNPKLVRITKSDPVLRSTMARHYSNPKGFVGRQIIYRVEYDGVVYGFIAFGSTTKYLPGRLFSWPLNEGMNNIFYHIEKQNGKYPYRNFTTAVLLAAEIEAIGDYEIQYGDPVRWIETLVELPRTGDLYLKAGYKYVGETKGFTCKRVAGEGSDSWGGKRVWDKINLRPKKVFVKEV